MALSNTATLVVGTGNYYTAVVGTLCPLDLLNPPVEWTLVGHTSLEDVMSATSEGGDKTVLGTLQNKALRTSYAARTEAFSLKLQQFDANSLKLYYGSNSVVVPATATEAATQTVPLTPTPTTVAFLAVFQDGTSEFAFHAEKAEILRGEDVDLSDTESLASLPLSITPLANGSNTHAYQITPLT